MHELKIRVDLDNKVAIDHFKLQHWAEALSIFQAVLEKNQTYFAGKLHLDLASAHWNVSSCYLRLSQYAEAGDHVRQVYDLRKVLLGDNHDDTQKAYTRLLECLASKQQNTATPQPRIVDTRAPARNTSPLRAMGSFFQVSVSANVGVHPAPEFSGSSGISGLTKLM